MLNDNKATSKVSVRRQLDGLRLKIDSLPQQQRPFFHTAVDEAERQYDRMQKRCAAIQDMTGDLGLIVAHTKFDVEACRRELKVLDPHGRFQL